MTTMDERDEKAGETFAETSGRLEAKGPEVTEPEEKETFLESVASIATVLVCGIFLMGFVFQNFVIPSGSMEKTLLVGDHVFVDRISLAPTTKWAPFVHYREPRRGDIIVFMKPNPELPDLILVKRTIGIPGDHIRLQRGVVYLNGVAQNEPQAIQPGTEGAFPYDAGRDDFPSQGAPDGATELWSQEIASHVVGGELVVPEGKVFAMGDNRTHSLDGRFWGFVPRENILGRPLFNYWSFETTADVMDAQQQSMGARIGSFFTTAIHIFDKTRWSRTLHPIK